MLVALLAGAQLYVLALNQFWTRTKQGITDPYPKIHDHIFVKTLFGISNTMT